MTEGRLYRSGGADGTAAPDAIPALTKDQRAKLKSTSATSAAAAPAAPVPTVAPIAVEAIQVDAIEVQRGDAEERNNVKAAGITVSAKQVWLLICGVTVVVGFIDGFIHRGGSEASALTAFTGIALLISTAIAAVLVRAGDRWYPVIVPPIAFLIATLTAGQFGLSSTGSLLIREGLMVFTTLGRNAIWIFIAVLAAAVIGIVKSRLTK